MAPDTILDLELRLVQATFLENVLEVLSDLFSKANFDFSSTGLEVQAMDTSRVALVVLQLRAEAFDRYLCDRDHLSMGLNVAAMAKAFSFANNDDIITIQSKEDGFETVTITFESPSEITYFDLDFLGVNGVPVSIPEYPESEFQAIVRMPSAKFMRICNRLSCFGDRKTVLISVDKERVKFFTNGEFGSATIVCLHTQTVDKPKEATLIEMKEKVSLSFGLRYINSFSKVSTVSDQVTIKLSSKLPTVFEYKIAEMGYIRYYMVPAEVDEKGDEMQGIAKDDKMQNEGDEMQN